MTFKLISSTEISSIIPLLKILDPSIPEDFLTQRLNEMLSQGYECVGVYENEKLIAVSGLWIRTQYYVGKHIEPDNVIVHPAYQGKGFGEKLMQWIYDYGKSKDCVASELNCYVANEKGNNFWKKEGYKIIGNHYQRML